MKKGMVLTVICLSLAIAGIAIGCGQDSLTYRTNDSSLQGSLTNVTTVDDSLEGLTDERVADGILIRLTTDKATYKLGEQVDVVVYVENQSAETLRYEYAEAKIHLSVWSNGESYPVIGGDGFLYYERLMARSGELQAGESMTLDTFWSQQFIDDTEDITIFDAAPGNYTIRASFAGLEYLRSIEGLPRYTDSVSVTIIVEG